ncbi:Zinc finger C2HC domain-containing protein 1C [Holothuria leucospilota]|uniref:Zinc finger C2HC domain-containing protein 1C n=1 Tax=Holothuria leucospilota TaxID=206669 RepID=A0A9Q1HGD8_HOLLE|nr:Zinc finger C2HC domain-containing protein 1C [Holothuria leucospilota]
MAAVTYTQLNHNREQAMRRTAPPVAKRISAIQDGGRHQSAPQPSRLEQMQASFQQKLMKEKEAKLLAIHQKHQDQAEMAINRTQKTDSRSVVSSEKKGVVRDFFRERRQMEKSGDFNRLPPPGSHLQKMRNEQMNIRQQEEMKQRELEQFAEMQKKQYIQPQQMKQGYSKSKPLAPIKQPQIDSAQGQPPFPDGHFESVEKPSQVFQKKPKRAPHQIKEKSNSDSSIVRQEQKTKNFSKVNRIDVTGTPPRKLPKVAGTGKKHSNLAHKMEQENEENAAKLSDFQKWQLEQDQQREARLQKYEEKLREERRNQPFSYEIAHEEDSHENMNYDQINQHYAHDRRRQEYSDISAKEKELERLLAKHQEDLRKLEMSDNDEDEENQNVREMPSYQPASSRSKPQRQTKQTRQRLDSYENYEDRYGYGNTDNNINRPFDESRHLNIDEESDRVPSRKIKQEPMSSRVEETPDLTSGQYHYGTKKHSQADFYVQAALNEADETAQLNLKPCQNCGRRFAADRLAKHKAICKKASKSKRKVFDSTKHRTEGTELAAYTRKGQHLQEPYVKKSGSNWRKKHEEFVHSVKEARKVQAHLAKGGKLSDLPPPPPSENLDYKQCPYCNRKFNPTAAERHIPHCKNAKSRPRPPPKRR